MTAQTQAAVRGKYQALHDALTEARERRTGNWPWKASCKNTIASCCDCNAVDSTPWSKIWRFSISTFARSLIPMPLALLKEIPGIDLTLAEVMISELGVHMSVFQSAPQLASWAGVCPGNNESAGRRKASRVPKGNVYLKTALVEAAHAATRAKGTYLRDKFYRLKARRGYKRALVAIAHKILVSTYHMLSQSTVYTDLGDLYLDKLNNHQVTRNLVHRLERLGYAVTLTPKQSAA